MAEPRALTRQEQIVAKAQKNLERIEQMREQMIQQVELEMKRLADMRAQQEDFTQSAGTDPSLSDAAPASFSSQFDRFKNIKSNERLTTIGNEGVLAGALEAPGKPGTIDFAGKLETPRADEPYYSTGDRDEHYQAVNAADTFAKDIYVSGYYLSSGPGTKEYEYKLRPGSDGVHVNGQVDAMVHPVGYHTKQNYNGSSTKEGHLRRFIVTDIYTKKKFYPYHDEIGK